MPIRASLLLILAVPCSLYSQTAKVAPTHDASPILTELVAPLDSNNNRLQVNSPVFASVLSDWGGADCHLRPGAVIAGHVTALDRHANQGATVSLIFDHADCDHRTVSIHFILAAVIAAPPVTLGRNVLESSDSMGVLNGGPLNSVNHQILKSGDTGGLSFSNSLMQLGASKFEFDMLSDAPERDKPKPSKAASLKIGQVSGLKNITMQVDPKQDNGSAITSVRDHLRLEQATRFLLLVNTMAPAVKTKPDSALIAAVSQSGTNPIRTAAITVKATPPPSPAPEIDETSICESGCSVAADTSSDSIQMHASATLSTKALGFLSHDRRFSPIFGFEASLFYLDANNILFTYDPHHLRARAPSGFNAEPVRTVRAVLLNSDKLTIKRVLDWKIQGEGQYVWRVGTDKVLVHLGNTLRLFGPDLTVLKEIPLSSALSFVSVSPSENYVLVGIVSERHTREIHEEMVETMKEEPVEDVDLQLYDANFNSKLHATQDTASPVPVLSDAGEVILTPSERKNHFLVTELHWDRSKHKVADLISSCTPSLSTPQDGMVFITGCKTGSQHWYRMLRIDGHPVLTGYNTNQHFEECFSNNGSDFAIRSIHTHGTTAASATTSEKQITEQEINIYRSTDGRRLFSVIDPGVSFAHQSFALSPGGNQVAVLSDKSISLYPVTKGAQ